MAGLKGDQGVYTWREVQCGVLEPAEDGEASGGGGKDGKGGEIFVIYEGTDQMSKYAKDLGSRISHCWERESHTWRGSKLD